MAKLKRGLGHVRLGMLAANPVRRVQPPRWQSPEMRVWSTEQTQAFLSTSEAHRLHAAFVLLATTAMRRGEVVGLRWDAVDLDGSRVQVRQSVTTAGNKIVIDGAKTRRSRRSIALDDDSRCNRVGTARGSAHEIRDRHQPVD
ncbi:MAG TPA: hypothetical protein VGR26_17850 [Acidimicrobiales bacterium]|nr:hypothetical protein [Acidimicrobiales bacterium]